MCVCVCLVVGQGTFAKASLAAQRERAGGKLLRSAATIESVTSTHSRAPEAPEIPETPNTGGGITGRVTDADTGNGIPFTQISINRVDDVGGFKFAIANAGGFYTLTNVLTGVYAITFAAPSPYLSERYDNIPRTAPNSPALVTITSAFTTTNINAALRKGFVITGVVTDQTTGDPLPNVTVIAERGLGNSFGNFSALTSGNGNYTLGPLEAGEYRLRFVPADNDLHAAQWHDNANSYAAAMPLNITSDRGDVNAVMAYGSAITGSISDANGEPIASVSVSIFPAGVVSPAFASAISGADGQYVTSPGLAPGVYQAFFAAPSASAYADGWLGGATSQLRASLITVTANISTTQVNIRLDSQAQPPPAPGTLMGTVTANGNPLPGVAVMATGPQAYTAYTGIDGTYRIASMRSGAYQVAFSPPAPFAVGALAVSVSPGLTTTNGNIALVSGGRISGTVLAQDTNAPMSGVVLRIASTATPSTITYAYTDVDGRFTSPGLPSGSYLVSAQPGAFWGQYLGSTMTVSVAAPNITPNIAFALARGGTLSGFVCSQGSYPVPSAVTVSAFNAASGQLINTTTPNAFGFYQLAVPAGSYKVRFSGSGLFTRWYSNAVTQAAATPVTVAGTNDTPNIGTCVSAGSTLYLPLLRR
jgi:hypothetical protein